jgi:hypothetical protein
MYGGVDVRYGDWRSEMAESLKMGVPAPPDPPLPRLYSEKPRASSDQHAPSDSRISNRFCLTFRIRCNSFKTNIRAISNRGQN